MFNTKTSQLLFVKFPIFFPLLCGFILYSFPLFEKELILITIFLLAENHNRENVLKHLLKIIN